jgi:hypothetical protein
MQFPPEDGGAMRPFRRMILSGLKTVGRSKAIVFIRFQKRNDDKPEPKCECAAEIFAGRILR